MLSFVSVPARLLPWGIEALGRAPLSRSVEESDDVISTGLMLDLTRVDRDSRAI